MKRERERDGEEFEYKPFTETKRFKGIKFNFIIQIYEYFQLNYFTPTY